MFGGQGKHLRRRGGPGANLGTVEEEDEEGAGQGWGQERRRRETESKKETAFTGFKTLQMLEGKLKKDGEDKTTVQELRLEVQKQQLDKEQKSIFLATS